MNGSHLDTPRRAVELHALIVRELHRAGDVAWPRRERSSPDAMRSMQLGIAVDECDHRLSPRRTAARHGYGIQPTSSSPPPSGWDAHVVRVALKWKWRVGDDAALRCARSDHLAHGEPLRYGCAP